MDGSNLQWWNLTLIVAVPFLLLLGLYLLSRLEDWVEAPEQRAAAVASLMENVDETGELEVAVTRLLDEATARQRPQRRGGATRLPSSATHSPRPEPGRAPRPAPAHRAADPVSQSD